tara:strand:+ start:599 stop:1885 length:1287 start_codon:yes stop_codon:yes gene_type:complete
MYEDKELEDILLAKLIQYPEHYYHHHNSLCPELFQDITNRNIFNVYIQLIGANQVPDIINLSSILKDSEKDIHLILASILDNAYDAHDIGSCIKQLSKIRTMNNISSFTKELTFKITNREDSNKILKYINKNVSNLNPDLINQNKSISEQISDVLGDIEIRMNTKGITGIPTGFKNIDNFTNGWQGTDLVIIGGASSMGKTSLALTFAYNAVKQGNVPTAIFSYEMSYKQLIERIISNETGIDNKWIQKGAISHEDLKKIHEASILIEKLPLYIDDCKRTSLHYVINRIKQLVITSDVKLVFIDYLQLISAKNKGGTREQEISTIARALKNLAKELNITIIALSQLNRGVGLRQESRPTMADLRESGEIEQASDVVVLVYRPEYYGISEIEGESQKGIAEIIFAKGRSIGVGKVKLKFIANLTKFVEQ